MKRKCSPWFALHLDLAARDCSIAQHTNALIVERMPFPAQIGGLEDREFLFWKDRLSHVSKSAGYNASILDLNRPER